MSLLLQMVGMYMHPQTKASCTSIWCLQQLAITDYTCQRFNKLHSLTSGSNVSYFPGPSHLAWCSCCSFMKGYQYDPGGMSSAAIAIGRNGISFRACRILFPWMESFLTFLPSNDDKEWPCSTAHGNAVRSTADDGITAGLSSAAPSTASTARNASAGNYDDARTGTPGDAAPSTAHGNYGELMIRFNCWE